jgi:hypothetical protein
MFEVLLFLKNKYIKIKLIGSKLDFCYCFLYKKLVFLMMKNFFKLIFAFSFFVTAANADLEYADGSKWSSATGYHYANGDSAWISSATGDHLCTYRGKTYSSSSDKDFWDIHSKLNNGNPYPSLGKVDQKPYSSLIGWDPINAPSKSSSKFSWKDDDASTVADENESPKEEFKSLLEDLKEEFGKKFVTKVTKLLNSWLKKINSKKYKKNEIGSDDVYQAFNNVLAEDDVTARNVNKRVQQEIKDLID